MEYLHWDQKDIKHDDDITSLYNNGYVFTRIQKDTIQQTRSVRINLNKFNLTSENRRILRKGENIDMKIETIPYSNYSWQIGKIAKDFYDKKAGGAFSANKIKEIITTEHNFNVLLDFNNSGYAICYKNSDFIHYCYPFYDIEKSPRDMGIIMMTKTIEYAKSIGLKYVYLGSLQRPGDVYKLQFEGIEWFDGKEWKKDTKQIKDLLNNLQ
jgi:arginyl-tRNA--protein-N-Asp/Glu arginylyltransferase